MLTYHSHCPEQGAKENPTQDLLFAHQSGCAYADLLPTEKSWLSAGTA